MRGFLILLILSGLSALAHAAHPTIQARNIKVSEITCKTATISWTPGNGEYSLVTVRPAWDLQSDPIDGQWFFLSNEYGKGSVTGSENHSVYLGPDSFVRVYGLSEDTQYKVQVYTLNAPPFEYLTDASPSLSFKMFTMHMKLESVTLNACRNSNRFRFHATIDSAHRFHQYVWTFPDSLVDTALTVERKLSFSGYRTVFIQALPDMGCKEQQVAKTVYIIPGVKYGAILPFSPPCTQVPVILRDSIEFDPVARGGYNRKWITESGQTFQTSRISQFYPNPGVYPVKEVIYTLYDNVFTGCTDTLLGKIQIYPPIPFQLPRDTCIPAKEALKLQAPERYSQFDWHDGISFGYHYFFRAGPVKLTATDSHGCRYTDSMWLKLCDYGIDPNAGVKNLPKSIRCYPVPASDVLHIESGFEILTCRMYNLNGQKLYEIKNADNIDIRILKPGTYFIRIECVTGAFGTVKFTKI